MMEEVNKEKKFSDETGSAIIIALMVMVLLLGFVALAISRTTNETIASTNDATETKTFEAAQASLEVMTRNFDKIFEVSLAPTLAEVKAKIEPNKPEGFTDYYNFAQTITRTQDPKIVRMTGELFQGLNAQRDEWELNTKVTDPTGVEVVLQRKFYNNLIPIFQFGIFYDDNLEFHAGPRFDFGGRVHSNDNLFLMASTGTYFSSKVTSHGEVITEKARNNNDYNKWGDNVYIKNASGSNIKLTHDMGSVGLTVNGPPVFQNSADPKRFNADMPVLYKNANWENNEKLFQGNLIPNQPRLDLPLFTDALRRRQPINYIELIKRGKNVGDLWNNRTSLPSIVPVTNDTKDTLIAAKERYYNKTGIRISLADSQIKLPGCVQPNAAPVTGCGIRLDGNKLGTADAALGTSRGYEPKQMGDGKQATRINGERFGVPGRETWIKIESVRFDELTNSVVTADITADILALGVTEKPAFSLQGTIDDSRSIVNLQRFAFGTTSLTATPATSKYYTFANGTNLVVAAKSVLGIDVAANNKNCDLLSSCVSGTFADHPEHFKTPVFDANSRIVPFPINMFDTREGLYYEDKSPWTVFNPTADYGTNVPWAGVMSMVDINVGNFRQFLAGNYNNQMPNGTKFATDNARRLTAADIPQLKGWVIYVSDRRGDTDFDGEYDMEDIYGNNDGIKQVGEDVNFDGLLNTDYTNEAVKYRGTGSNIPPDQAATEQHRFYRRGVRLINGQTLPGIYDPADAANTRGFTVSSENGVYVKGNYNATGVASYGSPTPSTDYKPKGDDPADPNRTLQIPASIAADAVTILSNSWDDSKSFRYPFTLNSRVASETTMRFAMLAGDTMSSNKATPHQGGGDERLSGGVHNFKRFLESWGSSRNLNYAGSLINLFNSRNNNGAFKCCDMVYGPPGRNWVFDSSFTDIQRLPPGTPYFQTLQITGFQRLN